MFGLDDLIAEWGRDGGIAVAFLVALLLGLRHATDPDHLTAVSSMILAERDGGRRGALRLGLAWGAGHALTLLALGLPFVLWGDALPERIQQLAELAIGLLIVGLAVRLLVRWRRGYFHVHPHATATSSTPTRTCTRARTARTSTRTRRRSAARRSQPSGSASCTGSAAPPARGSCSSARSTTAPPRRSRSSSSPPRPRCRWVWRRSSSATC